MQGALTWLLIHASIQWMTVSSQEELEMLGEFVAAKVLYMILFVVPVHDSRPARLAVLFRP